MKVLELGEEVSRLPGGLRMEAPCPSDQIQQPGVTLGLLPDVNDGRGDVQRLGLGLCFVQGKDAISLKAKPVQITHAKQQENLKTFASLEDWPLNGHVI